MTEFFTGHALADRMNANTRNLLQNLSRPACLALFSDPTDDAAQAYATRITEYTAALGINLRRFSDCSLNSLSKAASDAEIDAILPLAPFPAQLNAQDITQAIGPGKDVEGQHPLNIGALALGQPATMPPTAEAAFLCTKDLVADLQGCHVAVVGASARVGRPLTLLLLNAGATVSVAQEHTVDLPALTRACDLIISATGVPGLITADHVRKGAILVDVGIIRTAEGLVGDIDADSVMGHADVLTHVPDGVGPVTTACLMRNTARLARLNQTRTKTNDN